MWPSEEILGLYILDKITNILKKRGEAKLLSSFRILEIGSGYSGLAGICLAKFLERLQLEDQACYESVSQVEICLTDGVKDCVEKI